MMVTTMKKRQRHGMGSRTDSATLSPQISHVSPRPDDHTARTTWSLVDPNAHSQRLRSEGEPLAQGPFHVAQVRLGQSAGDEQREGRRLGRSLHGVANLAGGRRLLDLEITD